MGPHFFKLATGLVISLVLCASPSCYAETGVAPLSLVDESAAVCFEFPQLESTWTSVLNSRLASRLQKFPPVDRLLSGPGFQQWKNVEEHVRRSTGKSLTDYLLGAVAQSVVVAIYLPEGKSPAGIVIAQARDATSLKQTLQAWAALEPKHVSQTREHRGQTYTRRAKSASSAEIVYYVVLESTIALSDNESLIRQVIDLRSASLQPATSANVVPTRLLGDLDLYRDCRSRLPADAAACMFVNTRKWDAVVDHALRDSKDAAWLKPVFEQVSAVSAAVQLKDEVVLTVEADLNGRPAAKAWTQFARSTAGGTARGQAIPSDAIAAVSARLNARPLIREWIAASAATRTDEFSRGRAVMKSLLQGRDLFDDVLPHVLRDWIIAVVPADSEGAGIPADLVARLSLDSTTANSGDQTDLPKGPPPETPADHDNLFKSVDHGLQFGMTLLGAVLSHQHPENPVLVEEHSTSVGTVRSYNQLGPWTPGYLVTSRQITLASSRKAVIQNSEPLPRQTSAATSRLMTFEQRYFPTATQLVWLDTARLRDLLETRSDWIAGQWAPQSTDSRQRVRKHLSNLEEVTKVFDAAFLAATVDEFRVRVVLGGALDRVE